MLVSEREYINIGSNPHPGCTIYKTGNLENFTLCWFLSFWMGEASRERRDFGNINDRGLCLPYDLPFESEEFPANLSRARHTTLFFWVSLEVSRAEIQVWSLPWFYLQKCPAIHSGKLRWRQRWVRFFGHEFTIRWIQSWNTSCY